MRPIIQKQGKSKRGVWTKAQKDYADRCCEFGCFWCWITKRIEGTPGQYHHQSEDYNGLGMRAPHHMGMCLCPAHHDESEESVHLAPKRVKMLTGYTESELVLSSQEKFGWIGNAS